MNSEPGPASRESVCKLSTDRSSSPWTDRMLTLYNISCSCAIRLSLIELYQYGFISFPWRPRFDTLCPDLATPSYRHSHVHALQHIQRILQSHSLYVWHA